ncbi:MAG: glycosyltransferase family 4 protein [Candidatus Krumholzibacteria bacterium]|nr:glycosyltransferase family 4 protein [Candidatus Krumholzibacteria bacterium]
MRILLANSEMGFRGGEFQTLALSRGLQRSGCEVMIAARADSELARKASDAIPCMQFPFGPIPMATPLALARLISRWQPDILHAQTSLAHTHLWLARKILSGAAPLVVSRRVAFPIGRNPFSLLKYRTGVSHYVPISKAAAASLISLGVDASRITIIPSGVDVDAFGAAKGSLEVEQSWLIEKGSFIIGTVAAFEIEKGHRTLIRAAADILRESPDARFILIGEGRLEREIRGEIELLGIGRAVKCVHPGPPLEEVLPLFSVFVLPSIQEGLSTALIAAMAAGIPVVATMTGGIPDVVSEGSGLLVPPGDSSALARAVVSLVNDEDLRKKMGEAGKKRSADFDMSRTVERTLALYRRILQ